MLGLCTGGFPEIYFSAEILIFLLIWSQYLVHNEFVGTVSSSSIPVVKTSGGALGVSSILVVEATTDNVVQTVGY